MRINELLDVIAEGAQASFALLEMAGNSFNVLIIVVGTIMMLLWIRQMAKYNKEAARQGTLK